MSWEQGHSTLQTSNHATNQPVSRFFSTHNTLLAQQSLTKTRSPCQRHTACLSGSKLRSLWSSSQRVQRCGGSSCHTRWSGRSHPSQLLLPPWSHSKCYHLHICTNVCVMWWLKCQLATDCWNIQPSLSFGPSCYEDSIIIDNNKTLRLLS